MTRLDLRVIILTCGPLIWINGLASDEEQTVLVTPKVLLSCSFE
jgi:hypothetical protein